MKSFIQHIKEKEKLTPHEVYTSIAKKRTPEDSAKLASAKEKLTRVTSGRRDMNRIPDAQAAEVEKATINSINVGERDRFRAVHQGINKYVQKVKRNKK
jgi:hypothetical protein